MPRGIDRSIATFRRTAAFGQWPMRYGRILEPVVSKTCREWPDTPAFLEAFRCAARRSSKTCPREIRALAAEQNPFHPSLKFEERRNGICVVRIGDHHRALGIREGEIVAWFWIGTHAEYNRFRF